MEMALNKLLSHSDPHSSQNCRMTTGSWSGRANGRQRDWRMVFSAHVIVGLEFRFIILHYYYNQRCSVLGAVRVHAFVLQENGSGRHRT